MINDEKWEEKADNKEDNAMNEMAVGIKQSQRALNNLNLDIAELRVAFGMSPEIVSLYKRMGDIYKSLDSVLVDINLLETQWGETKRKIEGVK